MKPTVFSQDKIRPGRGFSYQELKDAKMDVRIAKKIGIKIDPRRRSSHKKNTDLLTKALKDDEKRRVKEAQRKAKKKGKKKTSAKKPSTSTKKVSGASRPKGTTKKKSTSKSK